jgi:hypothetical protein
VATEQPTGYHSDPGPTPSSGYPPPVPARATARGPLIFTGIAGLVVGALLVAGAWLLFGNDGASSSPIAAPKRLGDYVQFADAKPNRENQQGRKLSRQRADWDRRSSERLSESHDGAGAVVQGYADDELLNFVTLEAFRAPVAFPPYVPYTDPDTLGFGKPSEEVRTFDDVACTIRNDGPEQSYVTMCLRSDDQLTVQVTHIGGDLNQNPEAVARVVSAAWDELS